MKLEKVMDWVPVMILTACICGGIGIVLVFLNRIEARKAESRKLYPTPPIPKGLVKPGVLLGSSLMRKSKLFEAEILGDINALSVGSCAHTPEQELLIVGETGARFIGSGGSVRQAVWFEGAAYTLFGLEFQADDVRIGSIQVLKKAGGERCQFLVRDKYPHKGELIDSDGRSIWTYEAPSNQQEYSLQVMAGGDIDGDGRNEFVATFGGLNGPGLTLLDESLHERWSRPERDGSNVELADTEGNGKLNIVVSSNDTSFDVVTGSGTLLRRCETGHFLGQFSITRWPNGAGKQHILVYQDGPFSIIDFNGRTVAEYPSALGHNANRAYGVPLRLKSGEADYFAILAYSTTFGRSELDIYDSEKRLVYKDILAETCRAITSFPLEGAGVDKLAVGCKGKVYQYIAQ